MTDALVMGAIANRYDPNVAPVLAIKAGADKIAKATLPNSAIATPHLLNPTQVKLNLLYCNYSFRGIRSGVVPGSLRHHRICSTG